MLGYFNNTSNYFNIENPGTLNSNKSMSNCHDLGYIFHSISKFKPLRILGYIIQASKVGKLIKTNDIDILSFQGLWWPAALVVLFNKIHVPIIASFWGSRYGRIKVFIVFSRI